MNSIIHRFVRSFDRSAASPAASSIPFLLLLLLPAFAPGRLTAQDAGRTSVGGYGELHYNEPDGTRRGELDFHRFVLYFSHAFSEDVTFQSELELEHNVVEAGNSQGGYVILEQAYLDWRFAGTTGLRAGILLIPVGIINERHEPPTFHGVERPNVDRIIIPTTWFEAGAGLYGTITDNLRYQAYVVAGLKASGIAGSTGIRSARQRAYRSDPSNPSFTGRLDFTAGPSLRIGASVFAGNTTGGSATLGSGTLALFSGDAEFTAGQLRIRAVGARGSLGDAEKINLAYAKSAADDFYGWYGEGAYDVMPHLDPATEIQLHLFARYEKYNTQSSVTGFTADPAFDRNDVTLGLTLKPTHDTAFKLDYQFLNNESGSDAKAFNLGMAYQFN